MKLSLERAFKSIDVDEYVEATPKNLRRRKERLDEALHRRTGKNRAIKSCRNYSAIQLSAARMVETIRAVSFFP